MPYMTQKFGDQWCVFKEDEDGQPEGDSLGCHASEEEATEQVSALYAQEARSLGHRISDLFRSLIGRLFPTTRATSLQAIYQMADDLLWGMELFLVDIYTEDEQLFAIAAGGGRLYKVPIVEINGETTLGALVEVEEMFIPRGGSHVQVIRAEDGSARWFLRAAVAVINRVGEIDSTELFDSFLANLETLGYPVLDFFHQDTLNFGRADWVAREGNVLLASGVFDQGSPLSGAFIDACASDRGRWGCSITYLPTSDPEMMEVTSGVTIPVYKTGVLRKIAILPESHAASLFTSVEVQRNMNAEIKEALITLFGDAAKAEEFIAGIEGTNRDITEKGLLARTGTHQHAISTLHAEPELTSFWIEEDPLGVNRDGNEPEDVEGVEDPETVSMDALVEEVRSRIPEPDLSPIQSALSRIETALGEMGVRLGALERSDDAKRQKWTADLPSRTTRERVSVTYRPRTAPATENQEPDLGSLADSSLSRLPARRKS